MQNIATLYQSLKLSDFEQKITKRTKARWYFLDLFVTFVFFCKIQKIRTSHNQLQYKSIGLLVVLIMNDRSLTPRVRAALRRLAAGPQDMRDEALLQEINEEMKQLAVEEVAHVRDRVRYTCPPCPMVESVVLMLNGLIEVKNLQL